MKKEYHELIHQEIEQLRKEREEMLLQWVIEEERYRKSFYGRMRSLFFFD